MRVGYEIAALAVIQPLRAFAQVGACRSAPTCLSALIHYASTQGFIEGGEREQGVDPTGRYGSTWISSLVFQYQWLDVILYACYQKKMAR